MEEPTRILCIDDEQNVLRSLTRLFLDDPYEILTAPSATEGLLTESLGILDNLPMAIVGMDPQGPVFQCNRKGMVCFGSRIGPVIGANRRDVLTEAQNRLVDEVLEKCREAGNGSASAFDGVHQAVLERNPYATDCVILIVHEVSSGG
jgi:transcriptional regulator with PAS, ATPase and Fis domain